MSNNNRSSYGICMCARYIVLPIIHIHNMALPNDSGVHPLASARCAAGHGSSGWRWCLAAPSGYSHACGRVVRGGEAAEVDGEEAHEEEGAEEDQEGERHG